MDDLTDDLRARRRIDYLRRCGFFSNIPDNDQARAVRPTGLRYPYWNQGDIDELLALYHREPLSAHDVYCQPCRAHLIQYGFAQRDDDGWVWLTRKGRRAVWLCWPMFWIRLIRIKRSVFNAGL